LSLTNLENYDTLNVSTIGKDKTMENELQALAHVEVEEINYEEIEGFCPHCGSMLFEDDNLCPVCGQTS